MPSELDTQLRVWTSTNFCTNFPRSSSLVALEKLLRRVGQLAYQSRSFDLIDEAISRALNEEEA